MLRFLVFVVAGIVLCAGLAAADDQRAPTELEKAMLALQQPDVAKQNDGVEYILNHADITPSFTMFVGSAAQSPFNVGAKSVEVAYKLFQGEEPESDVILIAPTILSRENLADYQGWTAN